jgi:hypothetical protein
LFSGFVQSVLGSMLRYKPYKVSVGPALANAGVVLQQALTNQSPRHELNVAGCQQQRESGSQNPCASVGLLPRNPARSGCSKNGYPGHQYLCSDRLMNVSLTLVGINEGRLLFILRQMSGASSSLIYARFSTDLVILGDLYDAGIEVELRSGNFYGTSRPSEHSVGAERGCLRMVLLYPSKGSIEKGNTNHGVFQIDGS